MAGSIESIASKSNNQPKSKPTRRPKPTPIQLKYLARGVLQPGGKLPLFDESGRQISRKTIEACIQNCWAEPWFFNPMKPNWLVCKLTDRGRRLLDE